MLQVILFSMVDNVIQDLPLSSLAYHLGDNSTYVWNNKAEPTEQDLNRVFQDVLPVHSFTLDDVFLAEGTAQGLNSATTQILFFRLRKSVEKPRSWEL